MNRLGIKRIIVLTVLLSLMFSCAVFAACEYRAEAEAVYLGGNIGLGEQLDKSKISVFLVNADGSKTEIKDFEVGNYDSYSLGEHSVSIGFSVEGREYKSAVKINVVKRQLESISAEYLGKDVYVGDTLSRKNIKVVADYNVQTGVEVGAYLYEYDFSAAGKRAVTVTYTEGDVTKTDSFTVNVKPRPGRFVELRAAYNGADLNVGSIIDKNDVTLVAVYDSGAAIDIEEFSLDYDFSEKGVHAVNVVCLLEGKPLSTCFYVGIGVPVLTGLTAEYGTVPVIYQGSNLVDMSQVVVTARYSDGSAKVLSDCQATADGSKLGETLATVVYTEDNVVQKTTFKVNVVKDNLISIKAEYKGDTVKVGTSLDRQKISVEATYQSGKTSDVLNFLLSDFDKNLLGKQTVTVSYTDGDVTARASITVTVDPYFLTAISAEYVGDNVKIGSSIDSKNVKVTAEYENESTKEVIGFLLTGFDKNLLGKQDVIVSYTEYGVTATDVITVTADPYFVTAISAEYVGEQLYEGDTLDFDDIIVTASYEDNSQKTVTNFSAGTFTCVEGEQTLEISYTEYGVTKNCTLAITVFGRGVEVADYGDYGILQNDGSVKIINTAYVSGDLQIHFVAFENITSGDCVYIKAGDTDVLIDAGSTAGSSSTIDKYIKKYCTDGILEYAIATHAHADHISGYVGSSNNGILDLYKCENIIRYAKRDTNSVLSQNFEAKCEAQKEQGANVFTALECYNNQNGAKRVYQLSETVEMEILYNYYYDHSTTNENLNSVCILINQYGEGYDCDNRNDPANKNHVNHYLFTGDLEESGEEKLVQYNDLPEVVLYKAGHHGSNTASSTALLNVIKPKLVCLCSCAGDKFGFPHQETINRIAPFTQMVFYTNLKTSSGNAGVLNGNICVTSDSRGVFVNCSNNNILFKDTEWFKENRITPESWQ